MLNGEVTREYKDCRVDFFKRSGAWYTTETIKFYKYDELEIKSAFRRVLKDHFGSAQWRYSGMTAVCLHPNHQFSSPISIII